MAATKSTTAGTRKPAAKKAAPAKAAAKKAAPKTVLGKKIRWAVAQTFPNGKNQAGTGQGGTQYAITRQGNGEFTASVRNAAGKVTELVTGSFSAAYWAAVNHNKTAVDKAAATAAKKATPAAPAEKIA